MKIVKFLGGLGNQMFQYAFYLSLKQRFGKVKADLQDFADYELHYGFELEKVFGIQLDKATAFDRRIYTMDKRDWLTRKLRRIYGTKNAWYLERQEFGYDRNIYDDSSPRYYWGYWQHQLYHHTITPQLRQDFVFKEDYQGENLRLVRQLESMSSVAVHVRRGDYLGHPVLGDICDVEYYQQSIDFFRQKVENPLFVVFSNDIQWCKNNLSLAGAVFVDWNNGENSYRDMQLMTHCNHLIIANSSFSWWGAWLNRKEDKIVVSPKRWITTSGVDTSGMILPNWITL